MAERHFCATCAVRGLQGGALAGLCQYCGQPEAPQPIILVRNNCHGSISGAIYRRIRLERAASFLRCTVKNLSLPQLASTMGGLPQMGQEQPQAWRMTAHRQRRNAIFRDYTCVDWDAIARLCSLHVPAARRPRGDNPARGRGNLLSFPSGSLGIVAPPLKLTHKLESYEGMQEETLRITFHLCMVTPVHAQQGRLGFSADYPMDISVRKHWPENPGYADPRQHVKERL